MTTNANERDAAADRALFDNLRFTGSGSTVATTSDIKESGRHWIARAEAAEARAAELERQLADARSLVALKQADVDSLGRAFADERRGRVEAERERDAALSRAKEYAADADKLEISNATLRERGEALATAGVRLRNETATYAFDANMIGPRQEFTAAEKAWRESAPASLEEEKES